MIYCPKCGAALPNDSTFCGKCGAKCNAARPTSLNQQSNTTEGRTNSTPVVNTGTLRVLSIICILLCWPVALYGFICQSRANNVSTQEEANNEIQKGTRACAIAIGVMAVLFIIYL